MNPPLYMESAVSQPMSCRPGTRGRKRPTQAALLLLLDWRHHSLCRLVLGIHKRFADVLASSHMLQATHSTHCWAYTQRTGTSGMIPVAADSVWVSEISHTRCMCLKCSILCRNQRDQTRDLAGDIGRMPCRTHQEKRTSKSPR